MDGEITKVEQINYFEYSEELISNSDLGFYEDYTAYIEGQTYYQIFSNGCSWQELRYNISTGLIDLISVWDERNLMTIKADGYLGESLDVDLPDCDLLNEDSSTPTTSSTQSDEQSTEEPAGTLSAQLFFSLMIVTIICYIRRFHQKQQNV